MTVRPVHRILTIADLCDVLQMSRETVIRLIKNEGLPAWKVGGSWRCLDSDFNEWCEGRKAS